MLKVAFRFLAALIAFAVVGGPTMHFAQPPLFTPSMQLADMPCDAMMPLADAGQGTPMAPCKGMTPDCLKQMGCVVDVALPTRLATTDDAVTFSKVAYWTAWSEMAGVVRQPEPLPPRTA